MNKKKNISITQLFSHLEGIAVAPTLAALFNHGVIDSILNKNNIFLNSLSMEKSAQRGYLNVALSCLASLGVLNKTLADDDVHYDLTDYGKEFLKFIQSYTFYPKISQELNNFIINDIKKSDLDVFMKKIEGISENICFDLKKLHSYETNMHRRIAHHIEGVLLYPMLLYISHQDASLNNTSNIQTEIKNILSQDKNIQINDTYEYLVSKSKSYGVTTSYQPIFSNLDDIIFKDKNLIYDRKINDKEVHVNRKLNVWGSGGAHKTYFKKIDAIIIDMFNMPIDTQPHGIADMGCGDGMFLKHLYELILSKTIRGEQIQKHPLILIGADLNQVALNIAEENLKALNINSNFLIGDISDPKKYQNNLKLNFNVEISDLLHVRSFLDHNRIYRKVKSNQEASKPRSMCAYSYKGKYLSSEDITSNLVHHFSLWKKYIKKHGLILLELHGIDPAFSTLNKCSTPTIAYEATHGYSDQFIVEYEVFLRCAQVAGLEKIEKYSKVFPSDELVTISLNMFM